MFVRSAGAVGAVACAAALSLGLAGCGGGGGQPQHLPPVSTAPTSSPAATTTPSRNTALADATAVVRQYFRLLNADTSLDTAHRLAALMTPDCACQQVARSTAKVAKAGNRYFGTVHVVRLTASLRGLDAADVLALYGFSRSGIADANGVPRSSSPARRGALLDFKLLRVNGVWRIDGLIYVRKGHAA